jgi:hypothetical protein
MASAHKIVKRVFQRMLAGLKHVADRLVERVPRVTAAYLV